MSNPDPVKASLHNSAIKIRQKLKEHSKGKPLKNVKKYRGLLKQILKGLNIL